MLLSLFFSFPRSLSLSSWFDISAAVGLAVSLFLLDSHTQVPSCLLVEQSKMSGRLFASRLATSMASVATKAARPAARVELNSVSSKRTIASKSAV